MASRQEQLINRMNEKTKEEIKCGIIKLVENCG